MRNDRLLSMLGLAARAGRIKSGSFLVEKEIKSKKARLVIFAMDSRESGTTRELMQKCDKQHVPYIVYGNKVSLGHSMGKGERSCAAVTDAGFAGSVEKIFHQLTDSAIAERR